MYENLYNSVDALICANRNRTTLQEEDYGKSSETIQKSTPDEQSTGMETT